MGLKHDIVDIYRRELLPGLVAGGFDPADWLYSPEDSRLTYRRDFLVTIRPAGNGYRLYFAGDQVIGDLFVKLPLAAVRQTKSDAEVAREDAAVIADIEQAIAELRNRTQGKTG